MQCFELTFDKVIHRQRSADKVCRILRGILFNQITAQETLFTVVFLIPADDIHKFHAVALNRLQLLFEDDVLRGNGTVKNRKIHIQCAGKNPGMINSVSLESGKIEKLFPAAAEKKGWNVIALLLDNTGMPTTVEKRMENFSGIMQKAKEYGIAESRLFIDPLVFSVATTPEGFLNFAGAAKQIRETHPDIHIISGLSNISFGLPYRKAINHAFLIGAMMNGMDSAIMDPLNRDMLGGVYATEALLNLDEYCIEYLNAYRDDLFGVQK